jgi:hypothetical protein
MPRNGWFYYISQIVSTKKSLSIVGIVVLVLMLPLTVFLVQKQQEIRQRASTGSATRPTSNGVTYPWRYAHSTMADIPVVSASTKTLLGSIPHSSGSCAKKSLGDADCNNSIDLADLSLWQLDYEKHLNTHADFNGDRKVNLQDYTIWQQHASLVQQPVVQKISQKLGLEYIFMQTIWKFVSPYHFQVLAAETTLPEVTESSLQSTDTTYQITNEYSNATYSVQTAETGGKVGQMVYYSDTGEQLAQINNYFADTASVTTQIGNSLVTISKNPAGFVQQTIKTTGGGFVASQMWTDLESYTSGDFPNAVTLKIGGDFVTVTVISNKGAQVVRRDSQGRMKSYATIRDADVTLVDYQNKSTTVSNAETKITLYGIPNNIGGITFYLFKDITVVSALVTDSHGSSTEITNTSTGQYHITITNAKGEKTEKDSANPMGELGVESPSPAAMTQQTQQASSLRGTPQTLFSKAFAENGKMPAQILAVNRLLAVQYASSRVLGVKTFAQNEKKVLGEHTSLLAQVAPGVPYEESSPPVWNFSSTVQQQANSYAAAAEAAGYQGVADAARQYGASQTPASAWNLTDVVNAQFHTSDPRDAGVQTGSGTTVGSSASSAPASTSSNHSSAPAASYASATTSHAVSSGPAEVAAPANVATSVTNRDGTTFTSDGITTTYTDPHTGMSVTAVGGVATEVTVGEHTYSLTADHGWMDENGNPATSTTAGLDSALQSQANATGVDQVSGNQGTITSGNTVNEGYSGSSDVQEAVGAAQGAEQYMSDHPGDSDAVQGYMNAVEAYESACSCSYQMGEVGQQETTEATPSDPTADSAPADASGPTGGGYGEGAGSNPDAGSPDAGSPDSSSPDNSSPDSGNDSGGE